MSVRSIRGASEGPLNNVPDEDYDVKPVVSARPVIGLGLGGDVLHPIDNDLVGAAELHDAVMGPIQPATGPGVLPGIATDEAQWGGHDDAILVRIDEPVMEAGKSPGDGTSYYEHNQSSPECLSEQGPGAFVPSASLSKGVRRTGSDGY